MKKINDLIKQLAKKLKTDKKIIAKHINQLKKDDNTKFDLNKSISEKEYNLLVKLFKEHLFSKKRLIISYVLVNQLRKFVNDSNILFQVTKRTKFKQQQSLNKLEKLPNYIQNEYLKAADKILNWIEYSFISTETSKIISDIKPGATIENQTIDLRITFYEKKHPQDLNLIFKREPNSLKRLTWTELTNNLSCIKKINPDFSNIFSSSKNFLAKLADFLQETKNPKLIKKFFKRITVSPTYYEIIIEPEILIIDFSNIKLPSKIKVNYNQAKDILYLNFNNQFDLKCELKEIEEDTIFTVKFNDIPSDLELISV